MQLHPGTILKFLRDARPQNLSLRRRLAVYLIVLSCAMVALVFFVFNLIGIVNPIERQVKSMLSQRLDVAVSDVLHDADEAAAWGISLSGRLSDVIRAALQEHRISFDDLRNNEIVLNEIQTKAYLEVYTHMQLTTCSGAFYLLDTTVNDSLPEAYYNGLYLKYANLYAENTIHNKPCMFRGNYGVARENKISLYSTWQLETVAGTFPQVEELLHAGSVSQKGQYMLTEVYALPDSWERVRMVCVPIRLGDRTVGVCGFEISDLYFQLVYQGKHGQQEQLVCALLTETDGGWSGQMSGNRAGCAAPVQTAFSIKPQGSFVEVTHDADCYLGLVQQITIGNSDHSIAVMMPKARYEHIVRSGQIKMAVVLFVLALLAIVACIFLSHHYVKPILLGLSQIKASEAERQPSKIPEIDDLFEFLAARDRSHEAELARLQTENKDIQRERERAENALSTLHAAGLQEIDQEAYALFCANVCMLTPKEHEVFDLYLQGKNGKEIQEELNINQNTLKYHNKNIYNKLNVSSRKELLKYATLMQKDEKQSER